MRCKCEEDEEEDEEVRAISVSLRLSSCGSYYSLAMPVIFASEISCYNVAVTEPYTEFVIRFLRPYVFVMTTAMSSDYSSSSRWKGA